jgi:hypothetical protein
MTKNGQSTTVRTMMAISTSSSSVFRMPCYHTLRVMKQLNSKVDRSSFHSHWHFERLVNSAESGEGIELPQPSLEPAGPSVFAPHKVVTRGRKRKDNSTRRNRSQFELTAGAQRPGRVGGETSRVRYHPALRSQY